MQWSDLPDDLLHAVYIKVAGLLHRVRFAAVCKSWRAAAITARDEVPRALPWLVFSMLHGNSHKSKPVYCPEEGGVLRIRLHTKAVIRKRFVGAYDGGWVAAFGHNLKLVIMNLFSGVVVPLPSTNSMFKDMMAAYYDWRDVIRKVVFSESPTTTSCILAAITLQYGLALCRVGCPNGGWTVQQLDGVRLSDILFHHGHLYGITLLGDLVNFEIGVNKDGGPMVIGEPDELLIRMPRGSDGLPECIVELHDKLVAVMRTFPSRNCEPFFKVFELAEESNTNYTHMWQEVTSLGDCALFFGKMWSKAVYVPAFGRGGVQRNFIYADDVTYLTSLDGHGNLVYSMEDENGDNVARKIKSAGSYVVGYPPCGMWVLPPDF